jgi:hypothetical protein
VADGAVRERFAAQFVEERSAIGVPVPAAEDQLFAFDIDACLLTRTEGFGDHHPRHEVWRSGA